MAALVKILDGILKEASSLTGCDLQRGRAWSKFHQLRCSTTITSLWTELLRQLNVFSTNALLFQSVAQEIFEGRIKTFFPVKESPWKSTSQDEDISEDEQNIIMYVCGYVPVALKRRYEKRKGEKYASFVQCLLHMSIGAFEDSFYDYARKWFEIVNRGGTFEVSDSTYQFFLVLEKKTRHALKSYLHTGDDQKFVVDKIMADENIIFYWSMLSVDLDEADCKEILKDVVTLWLNIRGFSTTGAWVEQHKKIAGTTMKSKPSLRAGLKKSRSKK